MDSQAPPSAWRRWRDGQRFRGQVRRRDRGDWKPIAAHRRAANASRHHQTRPPIQI